jgi:hypothetical protein
MLSTTINTGNGYKGKLEVYGTMQNVNKGLSGRSRSSTHDESVATMLQAYTQSPRSLQDSVVVRPEA